MNIHTKTAFASIRRSPFQAAAAVLVLSVTFFVLTLISILVYASGKLVRYLETRPQVIVFIKKDAGNEEISRLQNQLINNTKVENVRYVSREDALLLYKEATSDNPLLAELVSPTIFPASLEFSLVDLTQAQQLIDELKQDPVADQIGFTANLGNESGLSETISRLKTMSSYFRFGGGALAGILLFTSLIVLLVIISMRLLSRRQEIEILGLIGATIGFIRTPVFIEAIFYAIVGAVLGWIFASVIVLYTAPTLIAYFQDIPILPKTALGLFYLLGIILFAEILISILLAISGTFLAVKRSRRKK